MPRAFCPECGSEVPVDADGICHVGHLVELAGASAGPAGDLDAAFPPAPGEPDEPQPWVASVDDPTPTRPSATEGRGAGAVPPPDAPFTAAPAASAPPDEPAWTPGDDPQPGAVSGADDLAAAAAAAVDSLEAGEDAGHRGAGPDPAEGQGEQVEAGWPQTLPSEGPAPGWTPPTNDPVAPPPVPAPAPAEPPAPARDQGRDDLHGGDFDLDDLAAAVSEFGMDEPAPAPTPGAAPVESPPTDLGDDDEAWADAVAPGDDTTAAGGDRDVEQRASGGGPDTADEDASVDLSSFTAKGRKGKGGGRGGLFRRR